MLSLACGCPSGWEDDGTAWFAARVFPIVIPVEAGVRHSAQRMGYSREMGSRFRGNDEEGWEAEGQLLEERCWLADIVVVGCANE